MPAWTCACHTAFYCACHGPGLPARRRVAKATAPLVCHVPICVVTSALLVRCIRRTPPQRRRRWRRTGGALVCDDHGDDNATTTMNWWQHKTNLRHAAAVVAPKKTRYVSYGARECVCLRGKKVGAGVRCAPTNAVLASVKAYDAAATLRPPAPRSPWRVFLLCVFVWREIERGVCAFPPTAYACAGKPIHACIEATRYASNACFLTHRTTTAVALSSSPSAAAVAAAAAAPATQVRHFE